MDGTLPAYVCALMSSEHSGNRPDKLAFLLLFVLLALVALELWTIAQHVGQLF